jgi:parvulin-like peptidyl-prolyl isomerase
MPIEFTLMLSDMRKRVRVVMFIVAAAFIAGFLMSELWRMIGTRGSRRGRDTHGFVGRVGDHNVTPEEYRAAVSYVTDKYKSDNRLRDLSSEDYLAVEQQAWNYLVSELTWAKVLAAEKIGVTQEEVREIVTSNPPEELRNKPELMTDGKFDQQKYLQVMNAPANRAYFTGYINQLVQMLPREKLRIDVMNAYRVTNPEVEDALTAANTKWKTTSLFFGSQVMKGREKVEPTEADARAWYDAHKDKFRVKEMRHLRYVMFPLGETREDSADAKEVIDRAYDQLGKGETFNLTMLDYSDRAGETLTMMVPRAQIDKPTDSVVSRLKPGQYSQPFLTAYGWQIALLDRVNKDSVSFRRILVRVKMGAEVLATARDSVRSFIEKSATEKFDTLAARFGLQVYPMRPLVSDQKEIRDLDVDNSGGLIDWARTAKPGQVFDQPLRGSRGYYVFELAEVKPAGVRDFDEVKQFAVGSARMEMEKQVWLPLAKQALDAVKAGKSLEQFAQENPGVELQVDSCNGIEACRVRKGAEFAGAVEALNPGEKYGLVEYDWGAFIIRCDERTPISKLEPADYAEQRRTKVAQALTEAMLKQPEVVDYRDALAY